MADDELAQLLLQRSWLDARIAQLQAGEGAGRGRKEAPESEGLARGWTTPEHGLSAAMIGRYSRQLLVPAFGAAAQAKLALASVLVVGAGGLGCPAALYLAAAGVGRLGIADHDEVELSNLHRQVAHREASVGQHKALSLAKNCRDLNSWISITEHLDSVTAANALDIIPRYDVVVDATDNVPTRYLLSDACVVAGKPLVSGAALGVDGQLTVYNHRDGPCHRCLFPQPPPSAACQRCSDSGVLGPVPGIIGTLEALEALKLCSGWGEPLSQKLLLLDGYGTRIQTVKLRSRAQDCPACGPVPSITAATLPSFDYAAFSGVPANDQAPARKQVVPLAQAVSAAQYAQVAALRQKHLLVDVRAPHEFAIAALPGARSIPLASLSSHVPSLQEETLGKGSEEEASSQFDPQARDVVDAAELQGQSEGATSDSIPSPQHATSVNGDIGVGSQSGNLPIYVICRRGNDSQLAVQMLRKSGVRSAMDVTGGLDAWRKEVDPGFPSY